MAVSQPRWAWHELDRRWAERLVADAGISPGFLVLDVGAGRGALTAALLARGARVIAIEAHPQRARFLRERFGGAVVVVEADAARLRLPRRPYSVVANPPFAVTSALLGRLVQRGSRLVAAHLIVQEGAARRWIGPTARGANRWRATFDASLGWPVPRSAFRPRPQVDARELVIRRRASHDGSVAVPGRPFPGR